MMRALKQPRWSATTVPSVWGPETDEAAQVSHGREAAAASARTTAAAANKAMQAAATRKRAATAGTAGEAAAAQPGGGTEAAELPTGAPGAAAEQTLAGPAAAVRAAADPAAAERAEEVQAVTQQIAQQPAGNAAAEAQSPALQAATSAAQNATGADTAAFEAPSTVLAPAPQGGYPSDTSDEGAAPYMPLVPESGPGEPLKSEKGSTAVPLAAAAAGHTMDPAGAAAQLFCWQGHFQEILALGPSCALRVSACMDCE